MLTRPIRFLSLLLALVLVAAAPLLAQDSPYPDASAQWVLAIAGSVAFFAQAIGSAIVTALNKVGGFLEAKSNGTKRIFAMLVTAGLGLAGNAIASALTHNSSWVVTLLLSVLAGVVSVVNATGAIETTKANARVRAAGPRTGSIYP